ncbi:hypothetical protein SASPL_152606 [Salvia splendens]|uniref:RNA helicase n=1 Tax=Salvia splendens TaxID=180675 RepID=A0A8X8Z133_SALSN|nr:hypothetical protein SASPL_152606 [Salvia splendens]
MLRAHFDRVDREVKKFCDIYKNEAAHYQSGATGADILRSALRVYFDDTGKEFRHVDVWEAVKDEESAAQEAALVGYVKICGCCYFGEFWSSEEYNVIYVDESSAALSSVTKHIKGVMLVMACNDVCDVICDQNATCKQCLWRMRRIVLLYTFVDIIIQNIWEMLPKLILAKVLSGLQKMKILNCHTLWLVLPSLIDMYVCGRLLREKSELVCLDVVSQATSSGAYQFVLLFSVGHSLLVNNNPQKPLAMVLTPTRELCIQVEEQAKLLGQGLPFKTALIVGGDAMAGQVHRIQQGVSMIVGTPGRLIDLLTKHEFELDSISILVIDEVDCMIERGFREQVMQIFLALSRPQVLMYSATISKEVERVAGSMVKDLAVISVGKPSKPSKAVKQLAIWVESNKKKQKLFDILTSKQHFKPPVVVFVGSRLGADLLSEAITIKTGVKAVSIHGEKKMERRDILRSFLVGEVSVIVATGVLGRGIDLLSVRLVIVFDMPNSMKEYVHQIGRASRMGEDGAAMVFVNEENKKLIPELVELLTLSGASIPRELAIANSRCSVSTSKSHKKRKYAHSR